MGGRGTRLLDGPERYVRGTINAQLGKQSQLY